MSVEQKAPGPPDATDEPAARATVFVADPSAEAEHVAQLLRATGYHVVDVPPSVLAGRVAVQPPNAVLLDADAAGAGETIARVREAIPVGAVDILLLGVSPESVPSEHRSSAAFFARPVDPTDLVRRIDAITGGPRALAPRPAPRSVPSSVIEVPAPPATLGSPVVECHPASSPASAAVAGPVSVRAAPGSSPPRDSPLSARAGRRSVSIQAPLCSDLEALLADAEQRVGMLVAQEQFPPTPEEEIEAVLPAAMLAALDEPLDEAEALFGADPAGSRPGVLTPAAVEGTPAVVDATPAHTEGTPAAVERTPAHVEATPAPPRIVTNATRDVPRAPEPDLDPADMGVAPTEPPPPHQADTGLLSRVDLPPPAISRGSVERSVPYGVSAGPATSQGAPTDGRNVGPSATVIAGPADAPLRLGEAIAARLTGCLCFEVQGGTWRRILLREGDVVTAASGAADETLVAFLLSRGDLREGAVRDHAGRLPPFGRHAGAALVAHGMLHQDELWSTLRAHAEWIIGRTLFVSQGVLRLEQEAPGRLRQEPSVFGGSSGAEVLVEVVRRVIPPDEAGRRLGGLAARIVEGPSALLSECALSAEERVVVAGARGLDVEEICRGVGGNDFVCVIYALSLLGVLAVEVPSRAAVHEPAGPDVDALDVAAVRDRVRARIELVSEADYFSLLGVARDATGYEIRREYLRLRRDFEPALLLTPETLDLVDDLTTIRDVLDEAYDILKDTARRERYRRALGDPL